MYDRILDGKELSIGVSGKLWKNVLIMYDRQTDTLWSHLTGKGLIGPLKGKQLKTHPSVFTTYAQWKTLFPDTLVLDKKTSGSYIAYARGRYNRDPYEGYYYNADTGVIPQKYRDNRLHPKALVIAVALERPNPAPGVKRKIAKVYPYENLNRIGVVNDRFAGRDLLVTYCGQTKTGVVFDRRLKGKVLTFEAGKGKAAKSEDKCGPIFDRETQSLWNQITGFAVSGSMKGSRLRSVPSTTSFWFGWKDYYPKSDIYRAPK